MVLLCEVSPAPLTAEVVFVINERFQTYFLAEKCNMIGLLLSLHTFTYLAGTGY